MFHFNIIQLLILEIKKFHILFTINKQLAIDGRNL